MVVWTGMFTVGVAVPVADSGTVSAAAARVDDVAGCVVRPTVDVPPVPGLSEEHAPHVTRAKSNPRLMLCDAVANFISDPGRGTRPPNGGRQLYVACDALVATRMVFDDPANSWR